MAFRQVVSFLILPAVAIVWWLCYNAVQFGNPLSFEDGAYSAQKQQEALARLGLLPTKGSVSVSWSTYAWTVESNFGWIFLALAAVGFVAFVLQYRLATPTLMLWVLCVFLPFEILSLYAGQTVIQTARTHPPGLFNVRYGIVVAPALACFVAMGVHVLTQRTQRPNVRYSLVAAVLVCLGTQFAAFGPNWQHKVITVAEGVENRTAARDQDAVARWIGRHDHGGQILIDENSNPVLPVIGLDLKDDLGSFEGRTFTAALADPAAHVQWVYMNTADPSDQVTHAMRDNPHFINYFDLRYEQGTVGVWERSAIEPRADQINEHHHSSVPQ
jgi:hypothetical protein